jgi:Fic family protein
LSTGDVKVPVSTAWALSRLGEALGKQELFRRQSPQRLKVLRENALIESAVSSNRIEGVEIDPTRVATVVLGTRRLRDRDEEEVRGYRDALRLIHEGGRNLSISERTIRELHRLAKANTGDAEAYKQQDSDIIERYRDGRSRIRFRTVPARQTPEAMAELISLWHQCRSERWVPPSIATAAFNLDFLCIHPFRDGNGRVSRLLLLLQCYHFDCEVGRFVSLERTIEENKDRYYETLEESSRGWHEGGHDPWPYGNYLLYILQTAYRQFEERVGQTVSPRGAKTEIVTGAIGRTTDSFRVADLQRECPGVSLDLIRSVLKRLKEAGAVTCLGRGQQARWRKTEGWEFGNTSFIR